MFLERQRGGHVTPETRFPAIAIDVGSCTLIQGYVQEKGQVGWISRRSVRYQESYSDDGVGRVICDLPAI